MDISSLQREKRSKKPAVKKLDSSLQWMEKWATPLKLQAEVGFPGNAGTPLADMRVTEAPATLIDAVEEIPSGSPETFLAYLQRDINCLSEDSLAVRLQSLQKLERVLVKQIDSLPTDVVDSVADALLKPLLKRMRDKSEKCRELSVRILRNLVENASDLSAMLAYTFPTLVARLGCEDLDGVAHLPEVMRPSPEQRPTEMARPVEESEEVRLELARFIASLLARCNPSQIYSYIDEATGLLRAQAMDPYHEVKALACETMTAFCHNHTEMLLHFSEPLGRSLTSCLTHNHAKIRIAGLRALTAVLYCGVWKHNFEIMQLLMAWQDPNKVQIKAFYEGVTNVNYMSMLTFDRHPAVRRFWFETLAYWLLRIPDKVDHEPYIFPYLLSGLCDENEEIALEVFWLIERCGELYEAEKEEDLRKTKQYGFDYAWTYQGRAFVPFPLQAIWGGHGVAAHVRRIAAQGPDLMGERELEKHKHRDRLDGSSREHLGEEVPLPQRDYAWPELRDLAVYRVLPRPRLGSRCWVRTHTRRYIKATFNDVVDFRDCTTLNAGRLLCMSLAYTEEGVTEWLQPMTAALCKFYSGRAWAAGDPQARRTYDTVCKLLGAFLDPASYWPQLRDALSPDCPLDLDQRIASVRILALCVEGSVTVLQAVEPPDPTLGMGRLAPIMSELIGTMHDSDLLLSPSPESRAAMWDLLFSFLGPLQEHLTFAHVSQLLFVAAALASRPPPEAVVELAAKATSLLANVPTFEEEVLEDPEKLDQALAVLSAAMRRTRAGSRGPGPAGGRGGKAAFSLDSLDDDDDCLAGGTAAAAALVDPQADPRVAHQSLFEHAFPEMVRRLDESFQVFRTVVQLTPLAVLTSAEHSGAVLERLSTFCGAASDGSTRVAGQTVAVHLAFRCARLLERCPDGDPARQARVFMSQLFQVMGKGQLEASKRVKEISYMATVAGLSLWRRFFLLPWADVGSVIFPLREPSRPLEWLTVCFADQELYKKFHVALEHAETSTTGRDREGLVVQKAKQIREEADRRASVVRVLAASTLLSALRRLLREGRPIPWSRSTGPGSVAALFEGAASLFRPATPTMDPPFVKPTPSYMVLYASEILKLLLHQAGPPPAFRLLDDAARAIHQLRTLGGSAELPVALDEERQEALAGDLVTALIDLNLTLPPDPDAKHAPASLDEAGAGDIIVGGDEVSNSAAVPNEVARVLAQSPECLGWNAALSMYTLGFDLTTLCKEGFQRCVHKWRRRKEQARVLIALDLLDRARRAQSGPPA